MAARGDEEHHLTSPTHQPHPPLHVWQIEWSLVESSQSHICQIVCSFSFIFLWRAIHNLHLWHRIHHVSHHILPPRDSNCWICDIIKHPFVSSLYTLLCHPALSLLSLSIHSPPSVQPSQSPHTNPYALKCKVYATKGISKSHANTTAAIQDGRIMNCSWRLRGARETKGFLLSCVPFLAPFVHF